MHLDLPDNRIKSLAELASLEEAYFVAPGISWYDSSFTGDVEVIQWPTNCISQTQCPAENNGFDFGLGIPLEKTRPTYAFRLEGIVLTALKVSEFNLVKYGRKKYGPAAAFRTKDEADIWAVTVSLAFEHSGSFSGYFQYDMTGASKMENIVEFLTA